MCVKEPRKEFRYEIPTLGRLRQENCEFKDSLSYIVRHCLREKKNQSTCDRNQNHLLRECMQSERILREN